MSDTKTRFVFWGGASSLSACVLQALLKRGLTPEQINLGVSAPSARLQTHQIIALVPAREPTIVALAKQNEIRVQTISTEQDVSSDCLAANKADNEASNNDVPLHLLVCYPFRLPASTFAQPQQTFINLHPSLLPANRGPDPVFWQLKSGAEVIGVSLHEVVHEFDSGDVFAQSSISAKDFPNAAEIEQLIAQTAADLFTELCVRWVSEEALTKTPQDHKRASYQTMPRPEDYELDCAWPVERAFRFAVGVWKQGLRFSIKSSNATSSAISNVGKIVGQPLVWSSDDANNRFNILSDDYSVVDFAGGCIQFAPARQSPL